MTFSETEKIELKQKFSDSLPKEIVAFLNTDGGTIYIGVNDDGIVCGVTKLDESIKKVVRFKGKSKADGISLRNEYGEKCLVVAMKQAFDYCADVINETRTSFLKGVRKDTHLFDRDAFREVWFNACLHNNWADGTPPAIYIFTDRMEIISTGGLPANLSKEDFYMGVSKPVNEELAKLFIRLDLMEQTGYGIPLVTKRYGKTVFEFLYFFLRVTIPFEFELESDGTQDDTQGGTQNDTLDAWIEEQIRKNPKVTTEELAKTSGKGLRTIKRHIAKLSHIKYVGSGYSGHWEVLENGEI